MTKHTPGPWTARGPLVDIPNGPSAIRCSDTGETSEQDCANARLVAAAPDMAEALKAALRCHSIELTDQETGETFGNIIRAALAPISEVKS